MLHCKLFRKTLTMKWLSQLGSSAMVSMTHKADMPYTNAFMQEVFRYRTLLPIGIPHKCTEATEIDGYVIPKGSQVKI